MLDGRYPIIVLEVQWHCTLGQKNILRGISSPKDGYGLILAKNNKCEYPIRTGKYTIKIKYNKDKIVEYKKEFSEYNVAILHGKMKNKEKDQIMHDFKDNKINILISTTVIEVGISVPNATLMIIENADRFGLAALHQLRGRVGRGSAASYCILKSNNKSAIARQRLDVMRKSNDGFEIAQKDLELRGPGDFFGIRQSGMPEFKLANLLTDNLVLEQTQEAVKEINKYIGRNLWEKN